MLGRLDSLRSGLEGKVWSQSSFLTALVTFLECFVSSLEMSIRWDWKKRTSYWLAICQRLSDETNNRQGLRQGDLFLLTGSMCSSILLHYSWHISCHPLNFWKGWLNTDVKAGERKEWSCFQMFEWTITSTRNLKMDRDEGECQA